MATIQRISVHFWFENEAEAAARYYTGIFKNSSVDKISHYTSAGKEIHKQQPGSVMTVAFTLDGQSFVALNGGPLFKFNEAISLMITCKDQDEIDHYWKKLSDGGDVNARQCGWLKDKFGVSWQVVPSILPELLSEADPKKAERVMTVFMRMKKIVINDLLAAASGGVLTKNT